MNKIIQSLLLAVSLAMPLNSFCMEGRFQAFVDKLFGDSSHEGLGQFEQLSLDVIKQIAQNVPDSAFYNLQQTSTDFKALLYDKLYRRSSWYWRMNRFTFIPIRPIFPHTKNNPNCRPFETRHFAPQAIGFSGNGKYLATAAVPLFLWKIQPQSYCDTDCPHDKHTTTVIGAETIKELTTPTIEGEMDLCYKPISAKFSPDNTMLAFSFRGRILLWDVNTGTRIDTVRDRDNYYFMAFTFLSTKELLAIGNSNHKIKICDFATHKTKMTIVGQGIPLALEFCPIGNLLVSLSSESNVHLWNIDDGQEIAQCLCENSNNPFSSMALSSDGTKIVIGSAKGHVRICDISDILEKIKSAKKCGIITLNSVLLYQYDNQSKVQSVAISADGTVVTSASSDKIIVSEVLSGNIIQQLPGTGPLAFSPDGKLLAARRERRNGLWQVVKACP